MLVFYAYLQNVPPVVRCRSSPPSDTLEGGARWLQDTIGLLKDKALKISLRGVDLLRGGSLYNVAVNPSSIIQTWTPVYGRYFLIDITYRFNNTNGRIMNLPF